VHDHTAITARCEQHLADLRATFAVPDRWHIAIRVVCPDELPHAYAGVRWEYRPYRQYLIRVRCDASPTEARWHIAHELLELILDEYGDFCNQQIESRHGKALQELLQQRHAEVRDSVVEWILHIVLPEGRPASLMPQ
jgi:hypothetical protein